jgi:hypothetical protein
MLTYLSFYSLKIPVHSCIPYLMAYSLISSITFA